MSFVGINHLLPAIRRIGHHEAEIKAKLLDYLPIDAHDLANRKIMNDLLAVKDDLSADGLALEHASRKFNFLLLVVGQVPLVALPE